jgi:hypothetical protein
MEASMGRTDSACSATFTSSVSAWAFSDTDRPVVAGFGCIGRLIHGHGPLGGR